MKKAQASLDLLVSFLASLLIASLLLSSFNLDYKSMASKLVSFQQEKSMTSELSSYYLTGLRKNVRCYSFSNVTVFNEKINPFLCSIRSNRKWFLK